MISMGAPMVGIDIGSTQIRGVVALILPNREVSVVCQASVPASGIQRGKIVSQSDLSLSIRRLLDSLISQYGRSVEDVIVSLPAAGIGFEYSVGFCMSSSDTGRITEQDRQESVRKAKQIIKPADTSILHVLPYDYLVDAQSCLTPVGVEGHHLETKCHLIYGLSSSVLTVSQIFRDLGRRMVGVVYDPLAEAQVVVSGAERDRGVIVLHIGGRFSRLSVFVRQQLVWAYVLPVGGETVSADIAAVLGISFAEAERLKVGYADVGATQPDPMASKLAVTLLSGERDQVSQHQLSLIAYARMTELIQLLLSKLPTQYQSLPMVVSGGGASLGGVLGLVATYYPHVLRLGPPQSLNITSKDYRLLTAIGLIFYGLSVGAILPPQSKPDSLWKKFITKVI
jgi:cell division protein FtsA